MLPGITIRIQISIYSLGEWVNGNRSMGIRNGRRKKDEASYALQPHGMGWDSL